MRARDSTEGNRCTGIELALVTMLDQVFALFSHGWPKVSLLQYFVHEGFSNDGFQSVSGATQLY